MQHSMTVVALLLCGAMTGAQEVQITFGPGRDADPCVSPNGKHLAFSSNRAKNFDVYVHTFGESGFTQITQSTEDDRFPSWSRDNKKIYFDSDRTGNSDIYETDFPHGSGFRQLSDHEDVEEYPNESPKGGAFVVARAPKKSIELRRKMSIALAASASDVANAKAIADGEEPRFSPDGTKIVFTSRRTKNNDIWVMSSSGGAQTQLTTDKKDDEQPCFSPDGKQIVFASKRTGNFDIWVMDADGSNQKQLTWGEADETQPCWSAGGYIYFVRKLGEGSTAIFRIEAP